MKESKIELFFLLMVAILALSFSLMIGFQFINTDSISLWDKLNNIKVTNIKLNQNLDQIDSDGIQFVNGFPYQSNSLIDLHGVSSFYQNDINLISTSSYWNFPLNEKNSKLIISNYSQIELFTDHTPGLPIISILVEPSDFFSYEDGIYVKGIDNDFSSSKIFYSFPWNQPANYYRKENDKRKIFFSYYDIKGQEKYSSYAFAEINGKATRCLPQKSLKLTTSKELGSKRFKFDFFEEEKYYKTMVLRNGGNDNTKALFRDMLMQSLMSESNVLTSGFVPCETYLNGEYWGIHFIQNKCNENFIAEKFNVKEQNITIVENWNLDFGSEIEYNQLLGLMNQEELNLSSVSEIIDVENLITFLATEIYFANTDWPRNNLNLYLISNSNQDSKWKFILNDLDFGFGYTGLNASEFDMIDYLLNGTDLLSKMFFELMKEKEFRLLLKNELNSMMNPKGIFNIEFIEHRINEIKLKLEDAISYHTAKWGKPASKSVWESEVQALHQFSISRFDFMKHSIEKYLK